MSVDERAFEDAICVVLVERSGYQAVKPGNAPGDFDAALGLDTAELFAFVQQTQGRAWQQLVALRGGDARARSQFLTRLASEIDHRGTIDVLRHGVVDLGVTVKLAFFRPAHGLTPELVDRYNANRLTVTRQLPYDMASSRTLDLVLFVNGLPVATVELKNPITGQAIEDAKRQYRMDRDPKNVTLSRRAVVHFAVDTEQVAMTTTLAGSETQFLPFNRGHNLGKGNPPNPDGYRTAYLWEQVWQRDAWLDLLQRFVHVDKLAKGARTPGRVIFPRYHQWDAVLKMTAHAREHGAGQKYLVQHSAGSGKSNTIAWLSHRLSNLHDDTDHKVFDKVIVITDRVVLDRQLQDTVYQFEHAHGVVERIDIDSAQLAEALAGQRARIIITTLQKFPFVLDKIDALPARTYAVVIDEAHSSQTGDTAKEMKKVLGAGPAAAGEPSDDEILTEPIDPVEEALAAEVTARGEQHNLSFFAFTATPKGRTLELFGRHNPATTRHEPFHLYSMRQAIEEGFILDVLAGYVTWATFFEIAKRIEDDPQYDPGKASSALARFVQLHPHVLAQKAQIIIEHFRERVAREIGGQAKAMVVTSSRKHAVRMTNALRRYVDEHGYDNIGILVAFSGTVTDEGVDYSEPKMNRLPESQTTRVFATEQWRFLVVADKYQTGFDQPLLYAMYVDKPLTGLAAVQTLSRLNRTHPKKRGTFVLDFRNDAADIRAAFEQWHGLTAATPTDPNLLYDTRARLDGYGVLWPSEAEQVAALLVTSSDRNMSPRVHAILAPAIDRFHALDNAEQDSFRDALTRFVRIYAFLSQVVAFGDVKLERDYLAFRALSSFIRRDSGATLDLGSEVELTQLKLEQSFEGSVSLTATDATVTTISDGFGPRQEPERSPLSTIIARLNERYGSMWNDATRLHVQAVSEDLVANETVQREAAANTRENFAVGFDQHFDNALLSRLDEAQAFTYALLDDAEMAADVKRVLVALVYAKARVAYQEQCPIGELLGPPPKESAHLEYKSTLRTRADSGELFKPLESATIKTVAAFLNSEDGGTLLVGVNDDGVPVGLESDFATLRKDGKDDRDLFSLHLSQVVMNAVGAAAATNVTTQMHVVGDHDICRVHVRPCGFPVDATVTVVKKDQHEKQEHFYVRMNNATRSLAAEEKAKYIAARTWGAGINPGSI